MVGVREPEPEAEPGAWGGVDAVVCEVGWTDDGTKEMERVPENRMTDTARATGRTAVNGFG